MSEIVTCARLAPEGSGGRSAQSWWIPRLPKGVPEARHHVQETMLAWGEPTDRVETATLIVTELVTNAVQHTTGRRIRCRLLRSAGGVRICVWNRGRRRIPAPSRPPMEATTVSDASHAPGGPRGPAGPHGPAVPHGPAARVAADSAEDVENMEDPDGPEGLDALKDLGAPEEPDDPENYPVDALCEDGRGLMLVDALATRWGTHAALASRLVWADI